MGWLRFGSGWVGQTQSLVGESKKKEAVQKVVKMYGFWSMVMRVMSLTPDSASGTFKLLEGCPFFLVKESITRVKKGTTYSSYNVICAILAFRVLLGSHIVSKQDRGSA